MKYLKLILLFILFSCSNDTGKKTEPQKTTQRALAELPGKIVTIPRNHDGAWYFPSDKPALKHGLQPDDIVEFEAGDYSYINLDAVNGTPGHPIRFRPKAGVKTTVGQGQSNISFTLTNSHYVIIEGDNRLIIGGKPGTFNSQSFTFSGSDNLEVYGVELCNAQVGFHSNRKGDIDNGYMNIYLHDNYVHNLGNPAEGGRAEGFYIGNTDKAYYKKGQYLDNIRIINNRIEDVSGDGIQMAKSTGLQIIGNTIRRYGQANLEDQNSGIIVGGCSEGIVKDNIIEDGKGTAIQVFGSGDVFVEGNKIKNTSTNPINDAIYLDGKCSDGPVLRVHLLNNTVDKAGRDLVRDVKGTAIVDSKGNSWETPIPPVDPPKPVKTVLKKGYWLISGKRYYYTVYTDFTWENKK